MPLFIHVRHLDFKTVAQEWISFSKMTVNEQIFECEKLRADLLAIAAAVTYTLNGTLQCSHTDIDSLLQLINTSIHMSWTLENKD